MAKIESITRTRKKNDAQRKSRAERLKRVWLREKIRQDLTQAKLAEKMGMKQGTLGGYLAGRYHLNTDTIFLFAQALNVGPEELDPSLNRKLAKIPLLGAKDVKIPVIGASSGTVVERDYVVATLSEDRGSTMLSAIRIDTTDYEPGLRKGSAAIIDPLADVGPDDYVACRRRGSEQYEIYKIKRIEGTHYVLQMLQSNDTQEPAKLTIEFDQEYKAQQGEFAMFAKITQWLMP